MLSSLLLTWQYLSNAQIVNFLPTLCWNKTFFAVSCFPPWPEVSSHRFNDKQELIKENGQHDGDMVAMMWCNSPVSILVECPQPVDSATQKEAANSNTGTLTMNHAPLANGEPSEDITPGAPWSQQCCIATDGFLGFDQLNLQWRYYWMKKQRK